MNRSNRFTLVMTKLNRYAQRTVESRHTGKILLMRQKRLENLRPARPLASPQLAAPNLASLESA